MFRFRPDPFRFRPPCIDRRFFPLFQLENWYLLGCQFGYRLDVDPETQVLLRTIRPGEPTLILVNHTNFADPHVVVELAFRQNFLCHWLAGIEPFDNAWGLFGWHIQRVGSMSVDRGMLDRWSLKTAQQTLEAAQVPLIIFPEGEADYSNRVLQPLYSGAAQMALHAQKHHADSVGVRVLPLAISYQFNRNPAKDLQKALKRLYVDIHQALGRSCSPYPKSLPLWEQALVVLDAGLMLMQDQNSCNLPTGNRSDTLLALKTTLAQGLREEHDPTAPADALSRSRVMDFKNRWRSLIARKRFAPPLDQLTALIDMLEEGAFPAAQLLRLEKTWIGLGFEDLPTPKRLQQLLRHLRQQVPYAQTLAQAAPDDFARWDRQMNQTRQIKLLTLIEDDLRRQDVSWMGVDELLTKMEILFLGAFRYRKGQTATVRSAPPLDVQQWVAANAQLSDKAKSEALTQTFTQVLSNLLAVPQGGVPWSPLA